MARVIFLNAELSGKLGGSVYSRNKGGSYVRTWARPTNPRTSAQLGVRSAFADASTAWNQLDDTKKASWNFYAVSYYKPKKGRPGTTYSGFQSFVGLRNSMQQAQRLKRLCTISAPAATATFGQFMPVKDPPGNLFSGVIKTSTGLPVSLTMRNATMTSSGVFTAIIDGSVLSGLFPYNFTDVNTNAPVGFVFYGGIPNKSQSRDVQLVCSVGPPSVSAGWSTSVSQFTLSAATLDLNTSGRKLWYAVGQKVFITGYALSQSGEFQPIGGILITIT